MAFMGMVFAGIALLLLAGAAVVILVLLIIATVLAVKKHKTAAIVLYCIACVPILLGGIGVGVYAYSARNPEFQTYDGGTVRIRMRDVEQMQKLIREDDIEGLDKLLDRHPELIYYLDINQVSLLEYGLHNCNIPIMQTAVEHGARFDDEIAFSHLIYGHSLENFFDFDYWVFAYSFDNKPEPRFTPGVTTDEIIAAADFAIDHGAAVSWTKYGEQVTFADQVDWWIRSDDAVSSKDKELLALAEAASH